MCTLEMAVLWVVAPCSLVEVYRQRNNPEDGHLHTRRRKNLKSHNMKHNFINIFQINVGLTWYWNTQSTNRFQLKTSKSSNVGLNLLCKTVFRKLVSINRWPHFAVQNCIRGESVRFAYITSLRVEGNKRIYYVNQTHYRHGKRDGERWKIMFTAWKEIIPYLLPRPPLWSPCHLLLTDLERTDSPRLQYSISTPNLNIRLCITQIYIRYKTVLHNYYLLRLVLLCNVNMSDTTWNCLYLLWGSTVPLEPGAVLSR
jgi:hypothetical protein